MAQRSIEDARWKSMHGDAAEECDVVRKFGLLPRSLKRQMMIAVWWLVVRSVVK
jgi:hypothetical protein